MRLIPPPFSSSKLASLAKIVSLAAALTVAEFITVPELLNWPTNYFTYSSNSLPLSRGLPLDTVSGLPFLRSEYNLFWYVVTQPQTVLSFKSSSCALLNALAMRWHHSPLRIWLLSPSTIPESSRNCPTSFQQTWPSLFPSGLPERWTLVLLLKKCCQHRWWAWRNAPEWTYLSSRRGTYLPKHGTRQLSVSHGLR